MHNPVSEATLQPDISSYRLPPRHAHPLPLMSNRSRTDRLFQQRISPIPKCCQTDIALQAGRRGDGDVWRFRSVPRGIVTAIRIVSRRARGGLIGLGRSCGGRSGFDRRIALSLSEEGAALKSRVGVARSPTPNRERARLRMDGIME